ncbi:MAG: type II secretion system protein GspM [Moraxella sp.]|nr:type II secretion system protein GspM [Moraxella sp.]
MNTLNNKLAAIKIGQQIQQKWQGLNQKDRLALTALGVFLGVVCAYLSITSSNKLAQNAKTDYQAAVAEAAWFASYGSAGAKQAMSMADVANALSDMGIQANINGNRLTFVTVPTQAATAVAWLDTYAALSSIRMHSQDTVVQVEAVLAAQP